MTAANPESQSPSQTRALQAALRRALPALRVSDDLADRVSYARDLWPRHHLAVRAGNVARAMPACVVWPESVDDVSAIVKYCAKEGIFIVPFGAGSGVCAGVLPEPRSIVLDLKRLAKIRAIDKSAPLVDVEAGMMGVPFEAALNREGFTLGHFPSSILCSTVGGWIAARSAGQCSGKYGKIEDMVVRLECVTGEGERVLLHSRAHGPSLVPLVVGSEGTLAIVTSAQLRLHPNPTSRSYAGYMFPTTEAGWEAMRAAFQAGLRPAVSRLYDPFDAMLARQGSVKSEVKAGAKSPEKNRAKRDRQIGPAILRKVLGGAKALNAIVDGLSGNLLGGSLVVTIFEGGEKERNTPSQESEACARIFEKHGATALGEGPARKWLLHRYSVSYRQAPVFAGGMFSDTMEVAAPWSKLGALYDGVRHALGDHVFVMAHMSHAYPDGCCIYFSFAGTAGSAGENWDEASERVYDRAWKAALLAVVNAGGTIAHHHGVGRSKAPAMKDEIGHDGIAIVRALKRAFDPYGILNPGNLIPPSAPDPYVVSAREKRRIS